MPDAAAKAARFAARFATELAALEAPPPEGARSADAPAQRSAACTRATLIRALTRAPHTQSKRWTRCAA